MKCPHCCGADKVFNTRMAERDLKRYRSRGPGKSTRLLIEALKATGVEGLVLCQTRLYKMPIVARAPAAFQ